MLGTAHHDNAVGIASQAAINGQRCSDLAAKMQAAPRIAVSEINRIGLCNAAAGGIGKSREKLWFDERLTEPERFLWSRRGQRFRRPPPIQRRRENRGNECAGTMASLYKTIAQQMFIGNDDRVTADTYLLR